MTRGTTGRPLDRRGLVERHAVVVTGHEPGSPLSVGNGELCFTADLTGLQTFPDRYPVEDPAGGPPGTLLGTQSQWGWHSSPTPAEPDLAATRRAYHTPRGDVPYVDMAGELAGGLDTAADPAESWLRANPHRLDLARIGLAVAGRAPRWSDLAGAHQRLDLWTGMLTSRFRLAGAEVRVRTVCHPERDAIGLRIESALLAGGGLAVALRFPYGSQSWSNPADWTRPEAHTSTLRPTRGGYIVDRTLDATSYTVSIGLSAGAAMTRTGPHELLAGTDRRVLELVVGFGAGMAEPDPPGFAAVEAAARAAWPRFWASGAAVELAGSTDPRAAELERRTVLSQYLTAIHCAGSLPPQETGLMTNSWRGRFHLEMHWWHGAHFPLWGRPELLERSLGWYGSVLPRARETARSQGYAGARWPKQCGPDGRESPSPIGPFLIWQQPQPILLAELVRRAYTAAGRPARAVLERYADIVLSSAEFMADFAVATDRGYQLGPPLVPAQEVYAARRAWLTNPTFELAWWQWGLRVAQRWRVRLGLAEEPLWNAVAGELVRPMVRDGRYAAVDVPPFLVRSDHPSMLYALGVAPPSELIDPETMRATLHDVLSDWDWESTWGWDYPAIAMTATRLAEPATAVRALLLPTAKNTYLRSGHNRQTATLPVYLPGNGGLLSAVALMAAGPANPGAGNPAPGFPDDGRWRVRHEGLLPLP